MSSLPVTVVASATALGCAVAGGVFFAFSSFVMPAIAKLPAATAIQAMQQVNVAAVNPPFMLVLFGSAATAVVGTIMGFASGSNGAWWMVGGTVVYVIGLVGLTMAVHVPLNDVLALVDPTTAGAAGRWNAFAGPWTSWNHVRALAGIASAGAFIVGALRS